MRLLDLYVLTFFCLVIYHIWKMFCTPAGRVHSESSGTSCQFWQRIGLTPTVAQLIAEPGITFLAGLLIFRLDSALGLWLQLAGLSLCVKEVVNKWRGWNRFLDALDSRIEGGRMNTAIREHNSPPAAGLYPVNPATHPPAHTWDNASTDTAYRNLDPALRRLMSPPNRGVSGGTQANVSSKARRFHGGPLGHLPRIKSTRT